MTKADVIEVNAKARVLPNGHFEFSRVHPSELGVGSVMKGLPRS